MATPSFGDSSSARHTRGQGHGGDDDDLRPSNPAPAKRVKDSHDPTSNIFGQSSTRAPPRKKSSAHVAASSSRASGPSARVLASSKKSAAVVARRSVANVFASTPSTTAETVTPSAFPAFQWSFPSSSSAAGTAGATSAAPTLFPTVPSPFPSSSVTGASQGPSLFPAFPLAPPLWAAIPNPAVIAPPQATTSPDAVAPDVVSTPETTEPAETPTTPPAPTQAGVDPDLAAKYRAQMLRDAQALERAHEEVRALAAQSSATGMAAAARKRPGVPWRTARSTAAPVTSPSARHAPLVDDDDHDDEDDEGNDEDEENVTKKIPSLATASASISALTSAAREMAARITSLESANAALRAQAVAADRDLEAARALAVRAGERERRARDDADALDAAVRGHGMYTEMAGSAELARTKRQRDSLADEVADLRARCASLEVDAAVVTRARDASDARARRAVAEAVKERDDALTELDCVRADLERAVADRRAVGARGAAGRRAAAAAAAATSAPRSRAGSRHSSGSRTRGRAKGDTKRHSIIVRRRSVSRSSDSSGGSSSEYARNSASIAHEKLAMEHRETVAELQTTRAAAEQLGVANGELEACMAELMRQRDELADVLEQTRAAVEEMEREGRWGVGDGGGPGSAHNCEDEDVDVDPHAHLMMMDSKDALAEGPNHHQHQYPSAALAGSWSAPASLSLADELAAGPPVPSATTPAAPAIIVSTAEVGVQMNPDSPSLAPAAAVGVSDAVVEPVAVIEPWAAPVGPEVGAPAPVPRLKSKMVALLPPTPTPSAGQLLPVIDTTHTISRNPLLPNLATTPRLLSARIPTSTVNTGNTLAFYLPPPNTIASRPISRSESAPSVSGYLLASAGARPLSTVSSTHHSVVPALSPAMLAGKLSEMSVRSDVARDRARTASLQSTAANAALHREPSTRSTLHSQFHRGIQNPVSTDDDDDEEVELGGGGVTMATLKPAMAASSTLNLLGSSSPSALPTAVPALDTDNVQILPSLESAFGLSLQPTAPAVVTTPAVATPAVFAASALVTPAVAPTQAAAVAVVEPPYAPLVSGDSKSLADDERESPRPAISTPELVRARTIGPSQSTSGMSPEKRHGMVLADDAALEAASAAMDELVVTPRAANLGGGVAVTPALRLVQKKDTPKPWPMWHPHPTADPDAAVADGDDDAFIEASDQEEQEDEEEETSGYTNTGGVKHNSHHTKARAGATVHRAVLPRRAGRAPPVPAAPVVVADPRNVHVPALLCGQWMLKFDRNGRHPRVRFFWVHDTAVFGDVKVFWAKRNPFAPEAMPPTVTEAAAAMGGWWGDNPAVWHHQVGGDAENGGPLGRRANGAGPHHMNALGVGLSFASKVANVTGVVQGMRGVHIPGMPTRSQHASPVKLSGSAAAPPPQFDASSSDSGATRQNQHHQTVHALDALRTTNTYLVLHTTSRRLDLQAPSQAAHDAWLYGLQYLLESPHTRTTSPIPSPVTAAAPASLPAPVSQLQRPTATAVPPPLPLPPAPKERKRSAVSAVVRAMMYKSKVNRGVASTAPPPAAAAAAGSFASRIQGFGSGSSSIPAPTTPAPRTAPTAAATAAGIAPRAAPATRTATATSAGSTASSMLLRDAPPPSRVPILSVPPSSKHHQHHLLADSKSLSANTSRGSLSRVPLTVHNPHDPAVAALSMGGGTVDGAVVDDAASSSTGSGSVRGGGGSGTPTTRVVSEGIKRRTSMMFASVVDKVRFN